MTGTPLWDPLTGAPFAISRDIDEISRLPKVRKRATIITSSVAEPHLDIIFKALGGTVNVLAVEKEIGCLITIDDLLKLDITNLEDTVILPGRTMAHDSDIKKALTRDGVPRLIRRGPDRLTVDGEMSISMNKREVIDLEIAAFGELIEEINALGV